MRHYLSQKCQNYIDNICFVPMAKTIFHAKFQFEYFGQTITVENQASLRDSKHGKKKKEE